MKRLTEIVCFVFVMILFMTGCSASTQKDSAAISSLGQLEELDAIITADPYTDFNEIYSDRICIYKIRYHSDDCEVVGYIAAPIDYLEKEYPILIYNRGGNRDLGALTGNEVAGAAVEIDQDLAAETGLSEKFEIGTEEIVKSGFIVLASQYRGVDGGTGMEQFGGDDLNDVIKLIDISESFSFARQGGVYMAGTSRGGMMTYMACRKDGRIKTAAVGCGISDSTAEYYEREPKMKNVLIDLIGGTPEELPEEYEKRSAVSWADEIDVPLLIVHGGEKDWRVLTHHATDMAAKLEEYGKDYRLVIDEEADHNIGFAFWIALTQWFKEHPIS